MAVFSLEVLTPERTVVSTEVEYALLPGTDGQFGVLANHQPLMAALDLGIVEFGPLRGKRRKIALGGGFVEMHGNKMVIIARTAELAEEIDVLRAREAKRRAEERLRSQRSDVDTARAQIALQKALLRLKVANDE